MAYFQTVNLVAGDTLPELTFELKDSNTAVDSSTELNPEDSSTWAPLTNLSGATAKLRIRELGSTTVKATLTCLVNASESKVATNFPAGTLDSAGTYEGELEITYAGGGIQTIYDLVKLKVRGDFD